MDFNRPDIVLIQKTEREKIAKYESLSTELKRLWRLEKVETCPVISAEGVMTTRSTKNITALGLYCNYKAYQEVINDVITNVREHFIEDGVDETVLQELKQLWQTKLAATKAVEETRENERTVGTNNKTTKQECNNGTAFMKNQEHTMQQLQMQQPNFQPQDLPNDKQLVGQVPPNNHIPQGPLGQPFPEWRRVPIQLTIPSVPGSGDGHRILSIDVPEVFLQGHHLKSILTGQNHVNTAFLKHQQSVFELNSLSRGDGQRLQEIPQRDGPADSTDDEEDASDVSDNDGEDDKEEEEEMEDDSGAVAEEEPLNSGDDVSDADGTEESFETENVIVCQYDKISRSRNRWKFHLKDGIMNLNGEDFIFQKANGDAVVTCP
ncbi:hypothetical protein NQ318_006884 [Aromia moschata]|uniref:TFIIA n=1 Tax=Aromia moschata TaxID=1265417 RepID=A0AAV8YJV6_9CUCU|nr:hypothetical protein NQ318_006884 [Aromia moschata]